MPYISQEARRRLFQPGEQPRNAGELNFCISLVIDQYWHNNGRNYQAFNDIFGALACVADEYYRRKAAYYEMAKMEENGDVFRDVPQEHPQVAGEGQTADAKEEPLRKGPKDAKVQAEGGPEQEKG